MITASTQVTFGNRSVLLEKWSLLKLCVGSSALFGCFFCWEWSAQLLPVCEESVLIRRIFKISKMSQEDGSGMNLHIGYRIQRTWSLKRLHCLVCYERQDSIHSADKPGHVPAIFARV